ncbi:MAG: hypothetical protein E7479_03300 [Ruminococcaceae bacterium]|nr:hypothetical protein [Oscillospiraceae bacterium]
MKKFIPFEKLSKKKKRELNAMRRKDWNGINPVTRKPENPKAYNRKAARKRNDFDSVPLCFLFHRIDYFDAFFLEFPEVFPFFSVKTGF